MQLVFLLMKLHINKSIVIGKYYLPHWTQQQFAENPYDLEPTWNLQFVIEVYHHKIAWYILLAW